MTALRDLVHLSRTLGRDPLLVQAGGGNISIKVNPREMIIKASGIRLKNVQSRRGWARSQFCALVQRLPQLYRTSSITQRELRYADLLGETSQTKGWRVSMEAGFHAVLPSTYIVHLHSVVGILLGLMPRAQATRRIQQMFKNRVHVHVIPPSIPGLDLTQHVQRQLRVSKGSQHIGLWILQNHGIIWTADQAEQIVRSSNQLEKSLRAFFKLKSYSLPHLVGSHRCDRKASPLPPKQSGVVWRELCLCHWPSCFFNVRPLFPDFTIYFDLWSSSQPDLIKTSARSVQIRSAHLQQFENQKEVFFAHALVSTLADQYGWLRPLPQKMIHAIKGLETERLRLAQAAAA